ncbi:MAG TPA: patatin-like phospholipase family protein [Longimicrobiales bacterium]|nr:patatin-like phospholipase family protein [Longimicrobiales bacterium]
MSGTILVLGGGGMKALGHVGALRALHEAGIRPAEVIGTSIGALVAALYGCGVGWAELATRARALRKQDTVAINRWSLMFNGIRQTSVFRGEPFQDYIRAQLPLERFDALSLPVAMNAVDMESGETVWFGAGGRADVPLADAVYASCALPLFYPPALIDGRHYLDGGVGTTLGLERAAERGAERIIAVDVGGGAEKDALDTVSRGLIAIHHRVFDIMSYAKRARLLAEWSGPPLVHVRPRLGHFSTFDFSATEHFLEEGYRATREALERAGRAGSGGATAAQA